MDEVIEEVKTEVEEPKVESEEGEPEEKEESPSRLRRDPVGCARRVNPGSVKIRFASGNRR